MGSWNCRILAENAAEVIKVPHLPWSSFTTAKLEDDQRLSQGVRLDAFVEILPVDVLPESGGL